MKQTIIQAFDDLEWHEHQQKIPADDTVTVGLNGRWYELDLTAAHVQELAKVLDRYLGAGNPPARQPKAQHGGSRHISPESLAYNKGLRKWVDEVGMKNEAGTGPAYTTSDGGKLYYSVRLRAQYDAYLRSQDLLRAERSQLVRRQEEL